MIPHTAIERAIEGGWKPTGGYKDFSEEIAIRASIIIDNSRWYFVVPNELRILMGHLSDVALDPSFWQSLGKALGWDLYKRFPRSGAFVTSDAMNVGSGVARVVSSNRKTAKIRTLDDDKLYEHGLETLHLFGDSYHYWKVAAKVFYDLILTGGDTKAFWDELLTN